MATFIMAKKLIANFSKSGSDAPTRLQPIDALLDDAPSLVRVLIKLHFGIMAGPLVVLVRNDQFDASILQEPANALAAVPLVTRQPPGTTLRPTPLLLDVHLFENRFQTL
jgi:hypothetical protein